MCSVTSRFDIKSVFFGFLIGFCVYLFFSHIILSNVMNTFTSDQDAYLSQLSLVQNNNNMLRIRDWIVPWAYHRNIESMANSDWFPMAKNVPPPVLSEKEKESMAKKRSQGEFYGGSGVDEKHLGGWKFNDSNTYERELWDWTIDRFNITSIMDIGCGIGCSTIYFRSHSNINDVLCVEGSIDAVNHSLVPDVTVHHDYTRGPFWPNKVYDMVWSAEFLEHVAPESMANYMATFKAAKIIFVTHSAWGGWHHVNVHESEWWIYQFESFGFSYQDHITQEAREQCPLLGTDFKYGPNAWHDLHTDGNRKNSHFHFHGLVFFNKLFMNKLTEYDLQVLSLLKD